MANMSDIASAYEREIKNFSAFTADIKSIIEKLLEHASINVVMVEARTKSLESLRSKLDRPNKVGKYSELTDVTDLSGIRIICYLKEEAEQVQSLVKENFDIDAMNSKYRDAFLSEDQLGYRADHLIISLNDKRLSLPELKKYSKFKAEIQIKTILEHAWSVVDWRVRYKGSKGISKPVLRRLYRISAVLEGADEDFSRIRAETDALRNVYIEQIEAGELDFDVNQESLDAFLDKGQAINKLFETVNSIGFKTMDMKYPPGKIYDRLLAVLELKNLKTISSIQTYLEENEDLAIDMLNEFYHAWIDTIAQELNISIEEINLGGLSRFGLICLAIALTSGGDNKAKDIMPLIPFPSAMRTAVYRTLQSRGFLHE